MIFRIRKVLMATALVFFLAGVVSAPAWAQQKIAVINTKAVLTESKAALGVQKQLEDIKKQYETELAAKQAELEKLQVELAASKGDKPSKELIEKRAAFETKVMAARQEAGQRQESMQNATKEAVASLQKQVTAVAAEIAAQEKYDLVLSNDQVIFAVPAIDITDKVMKALNEKTAKVEVKTEKPAKKK